MGTPILADRSANVLASAKERQAGFSTTTATPWSSARFDNPDWLAGGAATTMKSTGQDCSSSFNEAKPCFIRYCEQNLATRSGWMSQAASTSTGKPRNACI